MAQEREEFKIRSILLSNSRQTSDMAISQQLLLASAQSTPIADGTAGKQFPNRTRYALAKSPVPATRHDGSQTWV